MVKGLHAVDSSAQNLFCAPLPWLFDFILIAWISAPHLFRVAGFARGRRVGHNARTPRRCFALHQLLAGVAEAGGMLAASRVRGLCKIRSNLEPASRYRSVG